MVSYLFEMARIVLTNIVLTILNIDPLYPAAEQAGQNAAKPMVCAL